MHLELCFFVNVPVDRICHVFSVLSSRDSCAKNERAISSYFCGYVCRGEHPRPCDEVPRCGFFRWSWWRGELALHTHTSNCHDVFCVLEPAARKTKVGCCWSLVQPPPPLLAVSSPHARHVKEAGRESTDSSINGTSVESVRMPCAIIPYRHHAT